MGATSKTTCREHETVVVKYPVGSPCPVCYLLDEREVIRAHLHGLAGTLQAIATQKGVAWVHAFKPHHLLAIEAALMQANPDAQAAAEEEAEADERAQAVRRTVQ